MWVKGCGRRGRRPSYSQIPKPRYNCSEHPYGAATTASIHTSTHPPWPMHADCFRLRLSGSALLCCPQVTIIPSRVPVNIARQPCVVIQEYLPQPTALLTVVFSHLRLADSIEDYWRYAYGNARR